MAKIIVSENASLDGVVQDPTGEEGSSFGGWTSQITDQDRAAWAKVLLDEALGTEALLLGRRSDEWFAERWLPRSGEWADRLNSMPKYVVSSTLEEPRWSNSTVLTDDVVSEVSKLKQELDGDVVVYASTRLVHTLMEHDLVDELRLMIYPVVLGAGERLFGETGGTKTVRLVHVQTVGDGLASLTYELARDAFLPGPDLEQLLDRMDLVQRGPRTLTSKNALLAELGRVRHTGVAVNDEELENALRSVAAPVRSRSGEVVAAVNVAIPWSPVAMTELVSQLGPTLQATARQIAAQVI
jgi:dihydrofolate reductase